jgi:hypothetical protein
MPQCVTAQVGVQFIMSFPKSQKAIGDCEHWIITIWNVLGKLIMYKNNQDKDLVYWIWPQPEVMDGRRVLAQPSGSKEWMNN